MTELSETVLLMNSPDWADRLRAEYYQVDIRANKLLDYIRMVNHGRAKYLPKTPTALLFQQWNAMNQYREILKRRAKIEGVEL